MPKNTAHVANCGQPLKQQKFLTYSLLAFIKSFGMIFVSDDRLSDRLSRPKKTCLHGPRQYRLGRVEIGESGMPTGTVKWFNSTKGYGFIAPDNGGKDVFVHISAVERAGLKGLNENQKIGYELQSGRDGKESAGDLRLL
jgi:CspA family cold shock protein